MQILVAALRSRGIAVQDGNRVVRTRAGYWQRSAGAWSWCLSEDRHIGSQEPYNSIVAAIRAGQWDIYIPPHGYVDVYSTG